MIIIRKKITHLLLAIVMVLLALQAQSQETDPMSDSLISARLMQDNLELYAHIDSLVKVIKQFDSEQANLQQKISTLESDLLMERSNMLLNNVLTDTLKSQNSRNQIELNSIKQQLTQFKTELENTRQKLRDTDFALNECQIKLKDAEANATLKQARLEGKIDVNTTKAEALEREVQYLKQTITEKDALISEKNLELSKFFGDKSTSLHLIDSLTRALHSKELELVKTNERLKIIESQYNEMVAARTAAQNKKKKVRFVQGVALKNYRTPDFQLAPQSSASTATYVITNKNSGKIEFDYVTGVSLSLYDLSKPDGKYTYDAGMFFGFGGTNLFKNFYVAPSCKAFDFFHFMVGLNVAEYQQLQSGFNEGDALPPGMSIPLVKEWKANVFFGMTIDFELLSNIPKKI